MPLGRIEYLNLDALVSYYRQRFGIVLNVQPAVPLSQAQLDPRRHQYVAEALIARMRNANLDLDRDPSALLIGLTEEDICLAGTPDWLYAFALRQGTRLAVISSARMDEGAYGGVPDDPALVQTRVRKMVTKTLGLLYFNLQASNNPRSVLYGNILGLEDLDATGEDF